MRRNIQFIICVLAVLCLGCFTVMGQSRSYEGTITVNPVQLEQAGDSLYVHMEIVLDGVKVKSTPRSRFYPATDFCRKKDV